MKKIVKILILIAVVVLLVILGRKAIMKKRAADAVLPPAAPYALIVHTMQPKEQNVTLTLPALAEVTNDQDLILTSKIPARVIKILPSGSSVKKGDLLVTLDDTDTKAAIQSIDEEIGAAKTALQNMRKTHRRTKALYAAHGASIEQLQQEESKIAQLRASLRALHAKKEALLNNLSYTTITAPTEGIVSAAYLSEGSVAMPGKPLIGLSAAKGFSLIVRLPADLQPQALRFHQKVLPLLPLKQAQHGLRSYKAYLDTANLTAGERVETDVVLFQGRGILLPFDALLEHEGKSELLVLEGNRAHPKEVHITLQGQEGILVQQSDILNREIAVAKPDILLRLTTGIAVQSKE